MKSILVRILASFACGILIVAFIGWHINVAEWSAIERLDAFLISITILIIKSIIIDINKKRPN